MVPKLFGLEMVDILAEGWERNAHLAIGEVREDGSIDMFLMLEGGTLRYLLTMASDDTIVPAPYQFLARFTHEVLADDLPIVRRPATVNEGFMLSILPVRGASSLRVVYILEPNGSTPRPGP